MSVCPRARVSGMLSDMCVCLYVCLEMLAACTLFALALHIAAVCGCARARVTQYISTLHSRVFYVSNIIFMLSRGAHRFSSCNTRAKHMHKHKKTNTCTTFEPQRVFICTFRTQRITRDTAYFSLRFIYRAHTEVAQAFHQRPQPKMRFSESEFQGALLISARTRIRNINDTFYIQYLEYETLLY